MIARIATRGVPHFVAARQLYDRLALIQANAARLLGPPRPDDTVAIDADTE